jgi:hypothetical protein
MALITLATLSTFLGACLTKAGEKFNEKFIETLFEHKKDLAEGFMGLFKQEIITLGLNDSATPEEVQTQLDANPQLTAQIQKKLAENTELVLALREQVHNFPGGITITAKTVGQVVNKNEGTITQYNKFS